MPALATGAWSGGLLLTAPWGLLVSVTAVAVGLVWWGRRTGRAVSLGLGVLLAGAGVFVIGHVQSSVVMDSPVADLARQGAVCHLRLQVTSDPVVKAGSFDDY